MTREEVAALLGSIQSSWPQFVMEEATVLMWAHQLANVDARDGLAAIEAIIRTDERPPSIARFCKTAHGFAERRRADEAHARGLAMPTLSNEEHLARLREAREALEGKAS